MPLRRLKGLLIAPSMLDIQPSRLPSLILTPTGPLVYLWQTKQFRDNRAVLQHQNNCLRVAYGFGW
jgi:hypothetical protein